MTFERAGCEAVVGRWRVGDPAKGLWCVHIWVRSSDGDAHIRAWFGAIPSRSLAERVGQALIDRLLAHAERLGVEVGRLPSIPEDDLLHGRGDLTQFVGEAA